MNSAALSIEAREGHMPNAQTELELSTEQIISPLHLCIACQRTHNQMIDITKQSEMKCCILQECPSVLPGSFLSILTMTFILRTKKSIRFSVKIQFLQLLPFNSTACQHMLLCYPLGELHHAPVNHPGKIFLPFSQKSIKDLTQSSKKCEWFTSAGKLVFSASHCFQFLYKYTKPFFFLCFLQPHNRTQLKIVLRSHHQLPN